MTTTTKVASIEAGVRRTSGRPTSTTTRTTQVDASVGTEQLATQAPIPLRRLAVTSAVTPTTRTAKSATLPTTTARETTTQCVTVERLARQRQVSLLGPTMQVGRTSSGCGVPSKGGVKLAAPDAARP